METQSTYSAAINHNRQHLNLLLNNLKRKSLSLQSSILNHKLPSPRVAFSSHNRFLPLKMTPIWVTWKSAQWQLQSNLNSTLHLCKEDNRHKFQDFSTLMLLNQMLLQQAFLATWHLLLLRAIKEAFLGP